MALSQPVVVADILQSIKSDGAKTFSVYDGSSRCIQRYECAVSTIANGPCLLTTYIYSGANTSPIKSKETIDVWLSGYEE